MQNRETVYQHLDKMDTLLKEFEEKYPERRVYGYQKRYLDNIRRKLDECYTAYDEERQKENLESKAKQTETADVNKKPEKVLPAAEEKNDAESLIDRMTVEQLLESLTKEERKEQCF